MTFADLNIALVEIAAEPEKLLDTFVMIFGGFWNSFVSRSSDDPKELKQSRGLLVPQARAVEYPEARQDAR